MKGAFFLGAVGLSFLTAAVVWGQCGQHQAQCYQDDSNPCTGEVDCEVITEITCPGVPAFTTKSRKVELLGQIWQNCVDSVDQEFFCQDERSACKLETYYRDTLCMVDCGGGSFVETFRCRANTSVSYECPPP
jgi:hypothetical protein